MLSGDKLATAEAIAGRVNIAEVIAEVRPADKQQVILRLQLEGRTVAMVGDGINDAPALVTADLGIAIGSGADVAIESADIVLLQQDLRKVVEAIQLSRATLRTILPEDLRLYTEKWAISGAGLDIHASGKRGDENTTGFCLPPGVDNGTMSAADSTIIPNPCFGIYRLAHGTQ